MAIILEVATSRKAKRPRLWFILLAGYVVCARMYVHYFLNQRLEPMTDWETYGSQFTGWFLLLGVAVSGIGTVMAMQTLMIERRVLGLAITTARFIVLSAFIVLAFNTMRLPIRHVRNIPEDVKRELQQDWTISEDN